jgi:hypothetical protein
MNHDQAVQIKAPERYVIGDLASAERDEFEEHFAECSQCLDDVWAVSAFAANARAVFRERAVPRPNLERTGWLAWLRPQVLIPSLATLSLAVVVGYQSTILIPSLKAPQSLTPAIVLDGTTRGSGPQMPAGRQPRIQIALDSAPVSGLVRVELTNAAGDVISSGLVNSPARDEPLDVYFPVKLNSGRYTVVIRAEQSGRRGQELARSQFEVVVQEARTQ